MALPIPTPAAAPDVNPFELLGVFVSFGEMLDVALPAPEAAVGTLMVTDEAVVADVEPAAVLLDAEPEPEPEPVVMGGIGIAELVIAGDDVVISVLLPAVVRQANSASALFPVHFGFNDSTDKQSVADTARSLM